MDRSRLQFVTGVLDADGITIRLTTKSLIAAGDVLVAVLPEFSSDNPPQIPSDSNAPNAVQNPNYVAYKRYRAAYEEAQRAYADAYKKALSDPGKLNQWPIEGVSLQNQVDAAMSDWIELGHKNEIEQAIAIKAATATDQLIPKT